MSKKINYNYQLFKSSQLKYIIVFFLSHIVISCSSDSFSDLTENELEIENEKERAKWEKQERNRNIRDYKAFMKSHENQESCFMGVYFIGMTTYEWSANTEYLLTKDVVQINSRLSEIKEYYTSATRYDTLTYKIEGIDAQFKLSFFWDQSTKGLGGQSCQSYDKFLKSITSESENVTTTDYEYLLKLFTQKYGPPKKEEILEDGNYLRKTFKTEEHTIKLIYHLGSSCNNVVIEYSNHLKEKQKIEEEEKIQQLLKEIYKIGREKRMEKDLAEKMNKI